MQLRYETGLTGEEYVRAEAWRDARLDVVHDAKPAGLATRLDAYANTSVKRGVYSKQIEPGDSAPEPPPSPLSLRKLKEDD